MISTKYTLYLALFCILISSCKEKDIITKIEISSQADIDYICDNLPDSDTFVGAIKIDTDIVLDYKCLNDLRHIQGNFSLEGPGVTNAFRNIESVVDGESFKVCDPSVDSMSFPELRYVDHIAITSDCNFNNVLYLPKVEVIHNFLIASSINGEDSRSGTIVGLNNVEEILNFHIENKYDGEKIKIDGFANLKRVTEFRINYINEFFELSESSFNNLEEVNFMRISHTNDSELSYTFEYMFPSLKVGNTVELLNFDPLEMCYLKDHLASGDLNIGMLNTVSNEGNNNETLLDLCE